MLETYQLGNSVQKSQIVFYLGVLLDFTLENFDESVFHGRCPLGRGCYNFKSGLVYYLLVTFLLGSILAS